MPSKRIVLSLLAVLFLSFFAYAVPAHAQTVSDFETQQQLASLSAYFNSLKSLLFTLQGLVSQTPLAYADAPPIPTITQPVNGATPPLPINIYWSGAVSPYYYTLWRSGTAVSGCIDVPYTTTQCMDTSASGSVGYTMVACTGPGASNFSSSSAPCASSNTVSITVGSPPPAPSSVTATSVTGKISVTWPSSGAAKYSVWRSTNNGTFQQWAAQITNTYFDDLSVTQGTAYKYWVFGCASDGFTCPLSPAESNSVTYSSTADTQAPSTPPVPALNIIASPSQINLSWSASTDNVGVTGYKIYRCVCGNTANMVYLASVTGTNYSDTGLAGFTTYTYAVAAYDAAGNNSAQGPGASGTTFGSDATPPSMPTGLYYSGNTLYWNSSTDNVGVVGYKVYQNGVFLVNTSVITSSPSINVAAGYSYTVAAYDAAGNVSSQSGSVSATTQSCSLTVSIAQTTPATQNISPGQSAVSLVKFNATPSCNGTLNSFAVSLLPMPNGYQNISALRLYNDASGVQLGTAQTVTGASVNFASVNIPFTANQALVLKVVGDVSPSAVNGSTVYGVFGGSSAVDGSGGMVGNNASGNIIAGNTMTVAAGGGGDTTPPSTPTGLSATAISSSQINLSWAASTDNVGVTGYKIYRNGVFATSTPSTVLYYYDTGLSSATSYSYTVAAYDAVGNLSAQSGSVSATTSSSGSSPPTPSVPIGPAYGSTSFGHQFLSRLYPDPGGQQVKVIFDWGDGTAYGESGFYNSTMCGGTETGLSHVWSANGTYYVKVKARNFAGAESAWVSGPAVTIGSYTNKYQPTIPTGFSAAVISSSQINLSWAASTDPYNSGGAVSGYKIYRNNSLLTSVTTLSYSDTGLSSGTSYCYTIDAYNTAGLYSSQSYFVNATTNSGGADTTPPSTPTGLSATANSSSQTYLSWTASTDNVGVAGYKIYRNGAFATSTPGTVLYYYDNGLSLATSYSYTVAAYDAASNLSSQSNSVSATTSSGGTLNPPSSVTVTSVVGKLSLTWPSSGAAKYSIWRSTSGGTYQIWYTVTSLYYDDLNVSQGTAYQYKVYGCASDGTTCSSVATMSNSITYNGGNVSCTSLTLTLNDGKTTYTTADPWVNYTWTCSPGGNDKTVYMWLQEPDNTSVLLNYGGGYTQTFGISTSNSFMTTPGTYTLKACFGSTSSCTTAIASQTFTMASSSGTTTSIVPAVPSNLIYSLSNSNATVNLSWMDNSTSETRFEIYKQYSGVWNYLTQTSANVTSFSDNPPVGTYYYNVAACNGGNPGGGCSVGSNTVGPITTSYNSTTPNAPSNLTASVSGSNVYLNWTDNSTNESGFKLYGTRGGLSTDIGNVGPNVTTYTDSGLAAGTYSYKLQAFVSASSSYPVYSSVSNEVTVTVGGGGVSSSTILRDTTPPSMPTGLVATPVSSSQINLSWGASTDNYGVMGYKVFRNGTYFVSVASPSYSDIGLAAGTPQSYTVAAYDAAGNVSQQSAVISAATFASAVTSSTVSSMNSHINGSVLDASGLGVAFVGIHVFKPDFSLNFGGMTDSAGNFSINLPAGDYLLEINPPLSRYDLVRPDVVKVSIASGETKNLALKFAGTVKTLSGQVLFSNGQPVTDAQVGAFSNDTYQWTTATLDAAGNYILKVGKGKWQVSVKPAASSKWSYSDSPREVEFSPDNVSETKTVNFVIPVADVVLAIKTIDQSGAVIAGAGIVIDTISAGQQSVGTSRPAPQYARGDPAGSATFTLKAGTYFVRAFLPPEQGFSNPDEARVEVVSGDTKQVNLVFRKRDASTTVPVNGMTKLGDGTPIDAFVWAWSEQGGFLQGRSTTDGRFIFQVPKNTKWHVGAGKELNGVAYKTSEVIVAVTDTGTSVELVLAKLNDIFLAPNVNVTQSATEQVVVQAEDGAKMTLPPNAAGASGNVNVSMDPTVEAPSQGGARTIGAIYDVKVTDQSGSQVSSLQSEAEIVLPYSKDDLKKQGVNENNIVPSYFDDSTGTWRACENYTINKDKSVAICRVKHLTRFAIVAAADVVPPNPPSNVRSAKNELGEIVVSWDNPVKDFSHVKIYRSSAKGSLGQIILDNVTVSQSKDKSSAPGATYYYTVRAVDPAGNESTNTDQVSASGSKAKAVVKFSRSLKLGMSGDDVTALQEVLINERVYPEAAVTGYFGPKTRVAVIKFQEKYKADILAPAGLDKGNGFVGAGSRAKLDLVYKALLDSGAINQ